MSLVSDLKTLYHLTLSPIRGRTHAERLDNFYRKQAAGYDSFRRRLLKGREEMYRAIPAAGGGIWVDMGGGTGENLEHLGDQLPQLEQAYIVDLASSLLEVAGRRIADRGWTNVATVEADATRVELPHPAADVVTFSYSLTMIPDWFAAIERAWQLLKPGGHIGVVDFYVSRKYPDAGRVRHSWFTRNFWPAWFSNDNVYPNCDHVPFLHRRFEPVLFSEHRAKVPYLPLLRAPYYIFIGRKPADGA